MDAKILLVDDEPLITEELQDALEFEGFDVEATNSVKDALIACDENDFDLVITDLKMPHLGGLDLIRGLSEQGDAPIIFVLSGHGAESNRVEATALGAHSCFAKPIDPDVLVGHIRQVMG